MPEESGSSYTITVRHVLELLGDIRDDLEYIQTVLEEVVDPDTPVPGPPAAGPRIGRRSCLFDSQD